MVIEGSVYGKITRSAGDSDSAPLVQRLAACECYDLVSAGIACTSGSGTLCLTKKTQEAAEKACSEGEDGRGSQ